ncbi:MAG: molybdopterin biosynthesis protein, partial [Proteobacteria bacterium]|nr:molybdopterin biosynthesis protein [Pseudomonadota bacterium]NIS67600.1 molybdopterin biosynthesis protein [Pseudomonadota bacterium]
DRVETVPVAESLHRITAKPTFAEMSCPHYHAAAMDGMAVLADLTYGATDSHPKNLRVGKEAHPVDTGAPIPSGTNAVIKIEDVHFVGRQTIEITKAVYPRQNVRGMGEDIVTGEMILPENHRIRPYEMGALLAGGIWDICVRQKPTITVIPTGSEVVEPGSSPREGNIIDFNSTILKGLILEDGAQFSRAPILKDDCNLLRSGLLRAIRESDVVLIIAGSSAGSKDYTFTILDDLGQVLVHGVSIMPGKPTILSVVQEKPVVGIPGYPVSAIIAYEQFVRPLVSALLGAGESKRRQIHAFPGANVPSKLGVDEFVRVTLGKVGSPFIATPLPRGAGILTSLSKADGIIRIPRLSEGLKEGEEIPVELLRDEKEIENSIIMIGSHDLTLDLLATHLSHNYPQFSLSSSHVGSMGGIMAVQKGRAHLAGIHLFDPETNQYNLPYIKRMLGDRGVSLVHLALRRQGLILAPENPKRIQGLEDLTRKGILFVNRQRGSGTRILLDYLLQENRIRPETIKGYEREEFTHMAVAIAVLSQSADAGMGIYSAAKALDLSFLALATEQYDLVVPDSFFHEEKIQALLEVIRSEAFREAVRNLGGYDVSRMGQITRLDD